MDASLHNSPYLKSLFEAGPFPIRKPNITNLDNPHNLASSSYTIPAKEYFAAQSASRKPAQAAQGIFLIAMTVVFAD